MTLSADSIYNQLVGGEHTRHTDRAVAGTYYRGQIVQFEPGSGLVNKASGSTGNPGLTTEGTVVVGIVDDQQVVAADGDPLTYKRGWVALDASGFSVPGKLAYLHSDTVATSAVGSGRATGLRFIGDVSGSTGKQIFNIDPVKTPSGSLV